MSAPDPSGSPTGSDDTKSSPGGAPRGFPLPPILVAFALLFGITLMMTMTQWGTQSAKVPYSFFREQLQADNVKELTLSDRSITGEWKRPPEGLEGTESKGKKLPALFSTQAPVIEDRELLPMLVAKNVKMTIVDPMAWGPAGQFTTMLGLLITMGIIWFIMRRNADPMGPGGVVSNFIKSQAKRFRATDRVTTFDDVAGMEQAKRELKEIVDFLKTPERFLKLGAQIPKGVLLMGPPGTGKTLLARAVAGEAGVPFFSINGSEFIQMFVGVGASRVRDLFRTARESAPCIVFVDEIDAVGRVRGAGVGGGHDEREQTLNQILSEMDGFSPTETIIVLASTNRPDVLDPALLRPGRFDRHVVIDRPNKAGRHGILKVHTRKVPLDTNVDLEEIAANTIGFSGADLKNLVNEAALWAAHCERTKVTRADFDQARDRVLMGVPREEVLNEKERRMTAYHEAGHALIAWMLPELDAVHKVTIVPRGRALGVTQLIPEEERYHYGETRLRSQLVMSLGGRAAEKLVFDEYSAGAENDLQQASSLARRMVSHWGMSEVIGPVAFRQGEEHPFLGKEMHEMRQFSEATAHVIDQEVQRFLNESARKAMAMLVEHRDKLEALTNALMTAEVMDREEIEKVLGPRATV